jgi:hypothetical protein
VKGRDLQENRGQLMAATSQNVALVFHVMARRTFCGKNQFNKLL